MPKFDDLTDKRFGRLVCIERTETRPGSFWKCACDCGKVIVTARYNLTSGDTKSCGCLKKEVLSALYNKRGEATRSEYMRWHSMYDRCYEEGSTSYHNYGGRGIKMDPRWKESFLSFYEDMGPCPDGLTIERIDVNGDYTKENCRWANMKEQGRNRRNNVLFDLEDGDGPLTLVEQCEKYNVALAMVRYRIKRGWSLSEALSTPKLRSRWDRIKKS